MLTPVPMGARDLAKFSILISKIDCWAQQASIGKTAVGTTVGRPPCETKAVAKGCQAPRYHNRSALLRPVASYEQVCLCGYPF